MINNVILVGRLTKEPELRKTNAGISFTRFTLAVNRAFSNNGQTEADFISCVAWRQTAENLCKFMTKGSLISVEGHIQTGSYDDNNGQKRYTTDVVAERIQFLEPRKNGSNDNQYNYQQNQNNYGQGNGYSNNQNNNYNNNNNNYYQQDNGYNNNQQNTGSYNQQNDFQNVEYETPIKQNNEGSPFDISIDLDMDDDMPF